MKEGRKQFIKNYLSNLQVNLSVAAFTKVPQSWRDLDYVPEFNRFYFIKDGEGWVKIGDQEYYPKPGQLFLLPHGVLQSYSTTTSHTFTKYWCHFTATIGESNLFEILELPYFVNVHHVSQVDELFEKLIECYKSDDLTAALRVKALLLQIISYFIENTVVEKIHIAESSSMDKVNQILKFIENHLADDITIEELSKLVHFHPNYFIRFFKSMLGTSPIQYINKLRIDKAKQLLISTDRNVSEIAEQIGMQLYYFSRIFKNYTGFSPTEFRHVVSKQVVPYANGQKEK